MALFVLGDPHLSLGASKPMDIFPGWNDYVDRLEKNWRKLITPQDTIVLAGDISWAMRLTDTRKDFAFLQQLPGQKIIMKGNHDYWWSTACLLYTSKALAAQTTPPCNRACNACGANHLLGGPCFDYSQNLV